MTGGWRALTVRPPWSWAIAHGDKCVENRTGGVGRWSHHSGPVMIHAGKGWSDRGQHDPRVTAAWRKAYPWAPGGWSLPSDRPETRPIMRPILRPGEIVATCRIGDVHPAAGCCAPWGEDRYVDADGRNRTDLVHLVLEDVTAVLVPTVVPGRLGLWRPADGLVAAVELATA